MIENRKTVARRFLPSVQWILFWWCLLINQLASDNGLSIRNRDFRSRDEGCHDWSLCHTEVLLSGCCQPKPVVTWTSYECKHVQTKCSLTIRYVSFDFTHLQYVTSNFRGIDFPIRSLSQQKIRTGYAASQLHWTKMANEIN